MKTDKIVNIVTLIMGILFLILTFTVKAPISSDGIGPRVWPQLLSIIIIVLSVFNILKDSVFSKKDASKFVEDEGEEEIEPAYPNNLWMSLAMLCLYVLLMPYLGFVISTLIFIGVNTYIMGLKKFKFLIPTVIAIVAILIIVFPNLLSVPLPRGIGIFDTISRVFH